MRGLLSGQKLYHFPYIWNVVTGQSLIIFEQQGDARLFISRRDEARAQDIPTSEKRDAPLQRRGETSFFPFTPCLEGGLQSFHNSVNRILRSFRKPHSAALCPSETLLRDRIEGEHLLMSRGA